MWDHATGRSKGYGFVSMRTREEAQAAIEVMHGVTIGSRRVRCGWAQHKQVGWGGGTQQWSAGWGVAAGRCVDQDPATTQGQ
jgi:nucleolysin TIA-1/TIAR